MLNAEKMKQAAGEYAAGLIKQGTITGIGTGSTVYYFIQSLAKKVAEGLSIQGVATSRKTEMMAKELGIPMIDLNDAPLLDIAIDGADEISPQLQLIKGAGGALLQEKMVAAAAKKFIIIADAGKPVTDLGKLPLPVEVIPYGWLQTQKHIKITGCKKIILRKKDEQPVITDHGHFILDCHYGKIDFPGTLAQQLNNIPGVVENGLFIDMASAAIIGQPDGSVRILQNQAVK